MLEIRMARIDEVSRIMKFIRDYWDENHIMGNDETLFRWQHIWQGELMYVIAEDSITKELYGTMGVIRMSLGEKSCLSTMMVRSLNYPDGSLVGEEMADYLRGLYPNSNVIAVGVRKRYAKTLEMLSPECIGVMKHYYMLNPKAVYQISHISNRCILPAKGNSKLVPLSDFKNHISAEQLKKLKPYRSYEYLQHRYLEHPYYDYEIWGVQAMGKIEALFVMREIHVKDSKLLRIVDYLGEDKWIGEAGHAIQTLLQKRECEYIDFYLYGIPDEILEKGGFVCNRLEDNNIIPNHFEPFEQKNCELYFYAKNGKDIHIFLGMGDQDRPNRIRTQHI